MMKRAFIALALLWAHLAGAATYYAAPGGGSSASCVDNSANVCTVDRARVVSADGDTVILSAGTYPSNELGSSGYLLISSENQSWQCVTAGACTFAPSGTSVSGIRMNSPTTTSVTFSGIVIDGSSATSMDQCFYLSDGAAKYTVSITDVACKDPSIYGIRVQANELDLTVTDTVMTASTSVTPRSFLWTNTSYTEGTIAVSGGSATIAQYDDSGTAVIDINTNDAGQSFSLDNFSIDVSSDETVASGNHNGVVVRNISGASITNSTITINGNYGTVGALAILCYSTGAISSAGCVIDGNTITLGVTTGQAASVGWDQSSAGDGYSADGTISNNNITCTVDGTDIHGVGFFWSGRGRGYRNKVTNCGIGLLSKGQDVGATHASSIVIGAWNQYLYSKGSAGAVFANIVAVVNNSSGTPVVCGVDGARDCTNTSLVNSIFYADGGQPSVLLNTASGQTFSLVTANDWYGFSAPVWTYLGADYESLSAWNAAGVVGDDLSTDPQFVAPGTDYRLNPTSPLRRAGVCYLTTGCVYPDYRGYRGRVPPDIGAYQRN